MSTYKTAALPFLTENGRPVGVIGTDAKEVFFPTFSADQQSLLKPDGSALAGQGVGYVLPAATDIVLGGVKAGAGLAVAGDGTMSATGGGGAAALTATAFEAIGAGKLVYVRSDGQLALADNTAEGKEAIGFTLSAAASGATATWYGSGVITGLSGLTPGAAYFMGTAGGIGSAPTTTGNVVLRIGNALTAATALFEPYSPITL